MPSTAQGSTAGISNTVIVIPVVLCSFLLLAILIVTGLAVCVWSRRRKTATRFAPNSAVVFTNSDPTHTAMDNPVYGGADILFNANARVGRGGGGGGGGMGASDLHFDPRPQSGMVKEEDRYTVPASGIGDDGLGLGLNNSSTENLLFAPLYATINNN